jgi:IS30 family transposase
MKHYSQLTSEQRYQIYALLKAEQTLIFIADTVGKHKSTISREIARNTGGCGYRPIQAQRLCDQRKQGKYAGRFSASDWHLIEHLLSEQQWSPEQISLRLKEDCLLKISHERIYQHSILDKQTVGDLHTYLRERVKRRKRYGRAVKSDVERCLTRRRLKSALPVQWRVRSLEQTGMAT